MSSVLIPLYRNRTPLFGGTLSLFPKVKFRLVGILPLYFDKSHSRKKQCVKTQTNFCCFPYVLISRNVSPESVHLMEHCPTNVVVVIKGSPNDVVLCVAVGLWKAV